MKDIAIITTSDGSHSLLNTRLNETYHSHHGAVQESLHVFINHGLKYLHARKLPVIRVLEIGFGTGLNALLTLNEALSGPGRIEYTTIEAFPLAEEIWRKLNYPSSSEQAAWFESLHGAVWNEEVNVHSNFTLQKLSTTLELVAIAEAFYDLIYFDAFAPNKQPEMWHIELLGKVARGMTSGAVFVTYCAKGQLKRDLKSLNLDVQTLPGPPGKKEMVRALKK